MIEDTMSEVKRFAKVVDGKPQLFTKCLWCGSEIEWHTTFDGTGDLYDPMHSGSANCDCGWVCFSDGGMGQRLQELLDNPE